jgi:hypothetical protein
VERDGNYPLEVVGINPEDGLITQCFVEFGRKSASSAASVYTFGYLGAGIRNNKSVPIFATDAYQTDEENEGYVIPFKAGTGIKIDDDGTISVSFDDGDGGSY